MNESTTLELVLRSTFIFSGTVVKLNQSSVKVLAARPGFAIARFEHPFRVNPMLGKLDGRPITVQLAKGSEVRPGQRLIFFANSWVHGEQIAVTEVAHVPADKKAEQEVADTVATLPHRHLADRVAAATIIVMGTVEEVTPAGIQEPISEHAPGWMRATIDVQETLKGIAGSHAPHHLSNQKGRMSIVFPESSDPSWRRYPKLTVHQHAIFLLHSTTLPGPPPGTPMLTDPADVQPPSEAGAIRALVTTPNRIP
jgi:hypothetical protein